MDQKLIINLEWPKTSAHTVDVKPFHNGSSLLPSANYPESVVEGLPPALESGVYYGWARVEQGPVYKMVMSVGWNPQFQNEKRSMVSENHSSRRGHWLVAGASLRII